MPSLPSNHPATQPGVSNCRRRANGVIPWQAVVVLAGLMSLPAACAHSRTAATVAAPATTVSTSKPSTREGTAPPSATTTAPQALDVSWAGFHENIQPIMELHCYPCHSAERTEKDVRWDLIQDAQSLHDRRDQLNRALGMLYAGKMPPICAYPLSNEETVTLIAFMEARLKVDPPAPTPPAGSTVPPSQAGP